MRKEPSEESETFTFSCGFCILKASEVRLPSDGSNGRAGFKLASKSAAILDVKYQIKYNKIK